MSSRLRYDSVNPIDRRRIVPLVSVDARKHIGAAENQKIAENQDDLR